MVETVKYLPVTVADNTDYSSAAFDDSAWASGDVPVGYGAGGDIEWFDAYGNPVSIPIATSVADEGVWIRKRIIGQAGKVVAYNARGNVSMWMDGVSQGTMNTNSGTGNFLIPTDDSVVAIRARKYSVYSAAIHIEIMPTSVYPMVDSFQGATTNDEVVTTANTSFDNVDDVKAVFTNVNPHSGSYSITSLLGEVQTLDYPYRDGEGARLGTPMQNKWWFRFDTVGAWSGTYTIQQNRYSPADEDPFWQTSRLFVRNNMPGYPDNMAWEWPDGSTLSNFTVPENTWLEVSWSFEPVTRTESIKISNGGSTVYLDESQVLSTNAAKYNWSTWTVRNNEDIQVWIDDINEVVPPTFDPSPNGSLDFNDAVIVDPSTTLGGGHFTSPSYVAVVFPSMLLDPDKFYEIEVDYRDANWSGSVTLSSAKGATQELVDESTWSSLAPSWSINTSHGTAMFVVGPGIESWSEALAADEHYAIIQAGANTSVTGVRFRELGAEGTPPPTTVRFPATYVFPEDGQTFTWDDQNDWQPPQTEGIKTNWGSLVPDETAVHSPEPALGSELYDDNGYEISRERAIFGADFDPARSIALSTSNPGTYGPPIGVVEADGSVTYNEGYNPFGDHFDTDTPMRLSFQDPIPSNISLENVRLVTHSMAGGGTPRLWVHWLNAEGRYRGAYVPLSNFGDYSWHEDSAPLPADFPIESVLSGLDFQFVFTIYGGGWYGYFSYVAFEFVQEGGASTVWPASDNFETGVVGQKVLPGDSPVVQGIDYNSTWVEDDYDIVYTSDEAHTGTKSLTNAPGYGTVVNMPYTGAPTTDPEDSTFWLYVAPGNTGPANFGYVYQMWGADVGESSRENYNWNLSGLLASNNDPSTTSWVIEFDDAWETGTGATQVEFTSPVGWVQVHTGYSDDGSLFLEVSDGNGTVYGIGTKDAGYTIAMTPQQAFAFHQIYVGDFGSGRVYLDDVNVVAAPPAPITIQPPTLAVSDITMTSVKLAVTPSSLGPAATNFEYEIVGNGQTEGATFTTLTNNLIDDLESNTKYFIRVRSFADGLWSVWSASYPVKTLSKKARRLSWNTPEKRYFEAGLDRGVLFLKDGTAAAPWDGLISVEESGGEGAVAYYVDGRPFLFVPKPKEYQATLSAFMYPDEFGVVMGMGEVADGMYLDSQPAQAFDLTYRTLVGNGLGGVEQGYKIHLVYNATVSPQSTTYETLTDSINPSTFSWEIQAVPVRVEGFRPTAHIVIDTRRMDQGKIDAIEDLLYGTGPGTAHMPDPQVVFDILNYGDTIIVTDNGDGTFDVEGSYENVYMLEDGTFRVENVDGTDNGDGTFTISTTTG